MDLYQVCSYDAPVVKSDPAPGGGGITSWNIEEDLQNSSLKLEGTTELSYLVYSIFLWTSTNIFHMIPPLSGSKLLPPRGHNLEHRDKEIKFQNSSSLKLEALEL